MIEILALLLLTVAPEGTSAELPRRSAAEQDQEKPKPPAPAPIDRSQNPPGPEPEIRGSLQDGVHFKTADGNFDIILGGYVGIQYRFLAHRPDEIPGAAADRTSPDTWYIRQARPELSGLIYRDFDFRVQLDFPTGPAAIDGTLQDCWAGWRTFPWFSLRVGQFKEPFGQEETTYDRFLDFNERSEGDRFTPQRDIGLEVYGTFGEGFLTYEVGTLNGQGRAVADSNKGKEEAGRVRLQPFIGSDEGFPLKDLRLGVAGTVASVQEEPVAPFNTANSAYLNIRYLVPPNPVPAGQFLDGPRTRWGGEATWNWGPLGFRGEAWRRVDSLDTATVHHLKIRTTAWEIQETWLLTGDPKPIEDRLVPLHPFDPRSGDWGAFELAARLDRLRIDSEVFSSGVAARSGNANVVTGYSAGINWYLTRTIRISPDLFWEVFNRELVFAAAAGRADRHFFGGILRFQLEF